MDAQVRTELSDLWVLLPLLNHTAPIVNHIFFRRCMKAHGGGKPAGRLLGMIEASFGSFEKFKSAFTAVVLSQFGGGWVWLVQEGNALKIIKTSGADMPMAHGQTALLTFDVWEHAYYLGFQSRSKDVVEAFLNHLVNWDFAESQLR